MKSILVVEDEEGIRQLYSEELRDEGYEVVTASTGKEALEALEKRTFDIITLDIRMPEMDGLEFLGRIRKINMEIPIVICTAYSSYKQDFSVWGADAYVVKTADITELKEKISSLL